MLIENNLKRCRRSNLLYKIGDLKCKYNVKVIGVHFNT